MMESVLQSVLHWFLPLLAFAAAWAGFAALSLAMERHFADMAAGVAADEAHLQARLRACQPWLRAAGVAGLAASLAASIAVAGASQGWVLWLGMLSAGALVQVLALTYLPARCPNGVRRMGAWLLRGCPARPHGG